MTRLLSILLITGGILLCRAQKQDTFGQLNRLEQDFMTYDKDPSANALVLYERGDTYFEVINHRIWLVKTYHGKIKILNEQGFSQGTISIPVYRGDSDYEKLEEVRAITHNGTVKSSLMQNQVFKKDHSEHWSEMTFTFPNVKAGAILEYQYKVISPFIYKLNGWDFQSDIPKIYSEFNATIPSNYVYNRHMIGFLPLHVNDASIKKECFRVEGYLRAADCEVLRYAMKDIPAFKEEAHMLAASNYASRIDFELSEYHKLNGTTEKFTKSWEDVDREFKYDKDIGRQLTKKVFFEKNVPEALLVDGDAMTRARNIYSFIQDHFTWNGQYGIYRDIRVKEAFDEQRGNIGEINISLINLLNAAGIPTQLMLTSTRDHGLPVRTHPVMSDFNYVLARATIDGKPYLLDASDKLNPFGMVPYRCLNYYGRVMDFKNDSYWEDIIIDEKNKSMVRAQLSFDTGNHTSKGLYDAISQGYEAIQKRKNLAEQSREGYLEALENQSDGNLRITTYELLEERTNEKMVSERFEFELEHQFVNGDIYVNPFIVKFFESNPLTSRERQYPVDFAFTRNYLYNINVQIPEGYSLVKHPENKALLLPDNQGLLKFAIEVTGETISLYYNLVLNRSHYSPDQYAQLKELFTVALDLQNTSLLVFKKQG